MIKKAKEENLEDLYDLEKKVFQDDPFALKKGTFRYHILKNNLYIFEKDEKIVGYILWLERKGYFRLYSLAIDMNSQGLGIASRLLEYSFEKLGNKNFSLEVRTKNIEAIKLYEKYQFRIKRVLKGYYEDSDGYLMIK